MAASREHLVLVLEEKLSIGASRMILMVALGKHEPPICACELSTSLQCLVERGVIGLACFFMDFSKHRRKLAPT